MHTCYYMRAKNSSMSSLAHNSKNQKSAQIAIVTIIRVHHLKNKQPIKTIPADRSEPVEPPPLYTPFCRGKSSWIFTMPPRHKTKKYRHNKKHSKSTVLCRHLVYTLFINLDVGYKISIIFLNITSLFIQLCGHPGKI